MPSAAELNAVLPRGRAQDALGSFSSALTIEYIALEDLKSNPRNARTHSKKQVRQIAKSIMAFGFINPVLLNKDNMIIAGHGRVAAARLLKLPQVPTIRLENLTPDQVRAYVLADNRLAEQAGWDESILAIELQHLLTIDGDFDVTVTGFEIPEIDLLLTPSDQKPDPDDAVELSSSPPVSQIGDLWQLGRHRVFCGSALERGSYAALMEARKASVAFTDPPYNVPIDGHVSGKGAIKHPDFKMAFGEMSEFEYLTFLNRALGLLARFSKTGSVHFVCMDWRHLGELLTAGRAVYGSFLNLCVWVKNNGGMGSFYRSQHELVLVFRNGNGPHRNNIQLGQFGRNRTNVWQYPGLNSFSKQSEEGNLLALHPTVKPVALIADALLDCSARGEIVLDSFLGSGSTLIAAERTGRCCYAIELDPVYVDTAIRRWQRHAGDHAVHAVSGQRFDEVASRTAEAHG